MSDRERRQRRLADLVSGWWYMRPGETVQQHAERIKADPRYPELGTPVPADEANAYRRVKETLRHL